MLQEWLIWSEVIQAVFPPPTPNEVAEKLAYIPVTLKVPIETPKTNSGHVASSRIHVNRVVMIAPYYEEAVLGRRVKIPLKPFKERKITISTEGKEVATITGNCSGNTTLDVAKNHTSRNTANKLRGQNPFTRERGEYVRDEQHMVRKDEITSRQNSGQNDQISKKKENREASQQINAKVPRSFTKKFGHLEKPPLLS